MTQEVQMILTILAAVAFPLVVGGTVEIIVRKFKKWRNK